MRAEVVTVAPDVSGYVTDLPVRTNQFIKKGDILFIIDQERYRIALADAEATVSARLAQYQMLRQQFERRSKLTLNLSITQEDLDNIRRQTEAAAASHEQAIAARNLAALNLKRTEVRATVNGFVTNLDSHRWRLCNAGEAGSCTHRQRNSYHVDAYFEETRCPQIKPGATVDIQLMNGAETIRGALRGSHAASLITIIATGPNSLPA